MPIEVVSPAFGRVSDTDHQCEGWCPLGFFRFFLEPHANFFGHLAAFPIVTSPTGRHDVLPGFFTPSGDWDHVVKGEFFRPVPLLTVLAGVTIAGENIDAGELDGTVSRP